MSKRKLAILIFLVVGLSFLLLSFRSNQEPYWEKIERINREIAEYGLQWRAGETSLSTLPLEEFKQMLGAVPPYFEDPEKYVLVEMKPMVPSSFDWRNKNGKNWLTSIKNQGNCGSCWAFAILGVVESMYLIEKGNPTLSINLAEQDLVSCSPAGTCGGGWYYDAAKYIKNQGVVTEECFPYKASDVACNRCANWINKLAKINNYGYITQGAVNKNAILNAVQNGPLCFFMKVYSDFQYYTGGIYEPTPGATFMDNHAIVLVGYNDSQNYWTCKNSWGESWGENGYFRIRMGVCDTGTWVMKASGVTVSNKPPVLDPIGAQTTKEGQDFSLQLHATDPDNDTVTFNVTPMPEGARLNSATGLFEWTPSYTQAGVYIIKFIATDGIFEDSENVTITVANVKKGKGKV